MSENALDAPVAEETPEAAPEGGGSQFELVQLEGIDFHSDAIPEAFRGEKGGEIKLGALVKALTDTQAMARKEHPGAPEQYDRTGIPEAVTALFDGEQDPMLVAVEKALSDQGAPQETYQAVWEGLAQVIPDIIAAQPSPEKRLEAAEKYWGGRAAATIEGTEAFVNGLLDTDEQREAMSKALLDPDVLLFANRARNAAMARGVPVGQGPGMQPSAPPEGKRQEMERLIASAEFKTQDPDVQQRVLELSAELDQAEQAKSEMQPG